jgi:hypothetical protein
LNGTSRRLLEEVTALENAHDPHGDDLFLREAYELLLEHWRGGARDRETTLRLAYLAWYSWAEPAFLTRLDEAPFSLIADLLEAIERWQDEEACFVLHVMIEICDDIFSAHEPRLKALIERNLEKLRRDYFIDPGVFAGRGDYGKYFAHQARGQSRFVSPGDAGPSVTPEPKP